MTFALLPLLLVACQEYDLTADKPDLRGGDTGTPDLPPEAAKDPLYAQTGHTLYSVSPDAPYTPAALGDFLDGGQDIDSITDIAIDGSGILYAVTFTALYRVDATDASVMKIADAGTDGLTSLAFLADGTLLAGGGSSLYTVNPFTGAFRRLGSIGSWAFAGDMVGLPDGLLYCAMTEGSTTSGASSRVVFDLHSQAIVRTGATGTDALFGMAYADGALFGFNSNGAISTLDPTTGAASQVSSSGITWYGATTNPVTW